MSVCCILEVCCDANSQKRSEDLILDLKLKGTAIDAAVPIILDHYRLVPRDMDQEFHGILDRELKTYLKNKGLSLTE